MTPEIQALIDSKKYDEALSKTSSAQEEDEVFNAYFNNELELIPKPRLEKIGETFKEELVALGFDETSNPFISFIKQYLAKYDMDLYQYNIIHNLFIKDVLDKNDLNGKSKDGWNHVIFNPTLYKQSNQDIEYIIKIDDWIRNNKYSLQSKITRDKIINKPEYNSFKDETGIYNFRNDIIYKPGEINTGKFGGKPGNEINLAQDIKTALEYCEAPATSDTYINPDELKVWKDKLAKAGINITKDNADIFMAVLKKEYLDTK